MYIYIYREREIYTHNRLITQYGTYNTLPAAASDARKASSDMP